MKQGATPFLADDQNFSLCRNTLVEGPSIKCTWCKHIFPRAAGKAGAYPACAGDSTGTINQPISSSVGKSIARNDGAREGTIGVETIASPEQSLDTATCLAASHKTGGSLPPVVTDVG
eukprot:3004890-Heterocapsa_arctica.AAC.1